MKQLESVQPLQNFSPTKTLANKTGHVVPTTDQAPQLHVGNDADLRAPMARTTRRHHGTVNRWQARVVRLRGKLHTLDKACRKQRLFCSTCTTTVLQQEQRHAFAAHKWSNL